MISNRLPSLSFHPAISPQLRTCSTRTPTTNSNPKPTPTPSPDTNPTPNTQTNQPNPTNTQPQPNQVVVDTTDTGMRLVQELNRHRSGRVTFMPLDTIRAPDVSYPTEWGEAAVPMHKVGVGGVWVCGGGTVRGEGRQRRERGEGRRGGDDRERDGPGGGEGNGVCSVCDCEEGGCLHSFIPILLTPQIPTEPHPQVLKYDGRFKVAVMQVFGKTMVCQSREVAEKVRARGDSRRRLSDLRGSFCEVPLCGEVLCFCALLGY